MNIQSKTILVTGANRGIGRALVTEALRRGAKRVYAGTRSGELQNADSRVTPLTLDVTNTAQIQAAVEKVESLDILINNAGLALYDDLSDRATLEHSLAINLYGPYGVTQAFLPLLTGSRGAIISVLSLSSIAAVPFSPAYSILLSGCTPQLVLPLHSFIQAKVLQFVLHPRPHDHQLVAVQQQLPQVAYFTRRHPDPRKPSFHQQLQKVRRIRLSVFCCRT